MVFVSVAWNQDERLTSGSARSLARITLSIWPASSAESSWIGQHTHALGKSVGDADGAVLRLLAFLTDKVFVDRFHEQRQPAFEMRLLHWKDGVFWKGRALVITRAEKHRLPEAIHLRQMLGPIDAGRLVKNGREQLVAIHLGVKGIDQRLHIFRCFDVSEEVHRNRQEAVRGGIKPSGRIAKAQ